MAFLVDHGFARAERHGHLRERHLGIAAIELAHDAFGALAVARHEQHGFTRIDRGERPLDALIDGELARVAPAAQVDERGGMTAPPQDVHRIERAVRLADRRQKLARGAQELGAAQVPRGQHVVHALQVPAYAVDAAANELVGGRRIEPALDEALVDADQVLLEAA
jgi:hypothetical protein